MSKSYVICAVLALSGCASLGLNQQSAALHAGASDVTYQIGERRPEAWRPEPAQHSAIVNAPITQGRRENVCFRAAGAEACFRIGVGDAADLVIVAAGREYNVHVDGVLYVPAARFTPEYQAANRGRFQVYAPEVYELVNVAIALTDYAAANPGLVVSNTDYYTRMQTHFQSHRTHPFVQALSAHMQEDVLWYFKYKMNGYAFEFADNGDIVRSAIYDRTGFDGDPENHLLPLLDQMRDFARETGFRSFYAANQAVYREQIAFFENEADVMGMWAWLVERFPDVQAYDGVKLVFSPLVGPNQSITWIDEDGYRELQPHINFPYTLRPELTLSAAAIARSAILFTEVNHGFINPTADAYLSEIDAALGERSIWADDTKPASNYPDDLSLFLEYMNWGLISLYEYDRMSEQDRALSRARVERNMVERRGFRKFAEFNAFLVNLYANRAQGQSISDLYPTIIAWFAAGSAEAAP